MASVLDDVDVRVKYLPTQDMTPAEGGFGSRGAVSLPSGRSHFRSPRDSFVGSGASASLSLPLVLSVVDRRAVDGAAEGLRDGVRDLAGKERRGPTRVQSAGQEMCRCNDRGGPRFVHSYTSIHTGT